MSAEAQTILASWSSPIWVNVAVCLTILSYFKGWLRLRTLFPDLIPIWRLVAFLSGLFFLWVAIGSPLEAFDDASLSAHMVQHLLLMAVVPPLVLLGAPSLPLLRGLPEWLVRSIVGPILCWVPLQRLRHFLTQTVVCWLLATVALIAWHVPAAFELALRSDAWHEIEHTCFLATSLLFWWPVVQPFPSAARWPQWSIPVYLFFGMLPSGALGAFLAFCDRVLYPTYETGPGIFGASPLEDQIIAGVLMWVFGTFVCLVPAVLVTVRFLSPPRAHLQNEGHFTRHRMETLRGSKSST